MSLFGSTQSQSNNSPFSSTVANPSASSPFGGSLLTGGGSPFGGTNQPSQSQAGSGLFGTAPSQQQSTGSGLFGGLGQSNSTQQQPGSGGLFGRVTGAASNSQAGGGGLFGASASQAQQQTSGGLFGGIGNTQTAQQQPSGGLFGASSQSSQPQQQGGLGGSLFGASILNNNTQSGQATGQGHQNAQQPPTGLGSTTTAHFQSLLEKSNKRKAAGQGGSQLGELPPLQLGLGDISGKLQKLSGTRGAASARRVDDGRTRDLLAASGVPRGSTLRDLNSFATSAGVALSQSLAPTDIDIDSYVANQRAKSTRDLINESLEQTKRDFSAFLEENVQMNWQEQRQRIHEHFGISKPASGLNGSAGGAPTTGAFGQSSRKSRGPAGLDGSPASMSFGVSAMSRSILGGSISRGPTRNSLFTDVAEKNGAAQMPSAVEDPFLRTKQEKYAAKVRELNTARKQGVIYPAIEHFARVELEAGSDSTQHLVDAYRALKEIVKENSNVRDPSELGAIKERQYAKEYMEQTSSSAKSIALQRQILNGSRKFLEDNFYQNLDSIVSKNPQEANLGGVPSKTNKIRAYLRIRAARKDLVGEDAELQTLGADYCWALIFYLLRCGLFEEAALYVAQNERAIKAMDRHFAVYMAAFARDPDRRLPREMQTKVNSEYSQRSRLAPDNSIDPYRMACYKIVGRCDLPHKNIEGITMNMEDWMWLVFSLAREVNRVEEPAGEYFGLEDVQTVIDQIGQRHFVGGGENGNSYATFFFMQILAGLFEKAVSYLYPNNYVSAVHFAAALNFYGLLRVSDVTVSESELLTFTTRGQPQISFGRMLGYYTRDFRLARPESATDYLVLICLNSGLPGAAGESASAVCQQALKELVLETREFALLLGDVQANGQRIKGAIEERLPLIHLTAQDDFLRTLTIQAASVADDSGRTTDGVLLYHLAEEYDNVIVIINRALSDQIASDLGQDPVHLSHTPSAQQQSPPQSQQPIHETNSTLSLASVSDPATLARNMISLYNANALYFRAIRPAHREACGRLLRLATIRSHVLTGRTAEALDEILDLSIVPLRAGGNVSVIRSAAQSFNQLPQEVARCIGNLLVWTVGCLGAEREKLMSSQFQAGRGQAEGLVQAAKDTMVFAGLVRYKLPADVFEVLARAGQGLSG